MDPANPGPDQRTAPGPSWWDGLVAVALVALAAVTRRGMLPTDGLWFDDSWVAAGAVLGSPGELLTVGTAHPSFTALLMAIDRLGGGLGALTMPAMVASILTPVGLYLLGRRAGHDRPASLLAAGLLVVAAIPLLYAGRVKAYAIDLFLVLVLAGLVTWLADRRWRPATAVGWVLVAWVCSGFSGSMLMITGVAGVTLVLWSRGDLVIRAVAVGVQGIGQLWLLREIDHRINLESLDRTIIEFYDPHLELSANPIRFGEEVFEHLGRIGELYPGRSGSLAAVVAAAIAGLAVSAVRGRTRVDVVAARFLLALVVTAFVASLLGFLPFGARNGPALGSPGGRYNLWLVAPVGYGLLALVDRLLQWVPGDRARRVVDVGVLALAAFVVLRGGLPAGPPPQFQGADSATRYVEGALGEDDRVILLSGAAYSYPLSRGGAVEIVPTPNLEIGFTPVIEDDRFLTVGAWVPDPSVAARIGEHVEGAERVFVVANGLLGGYDVVERDLAEAGFEPVDERVLTWASVYEWAPADAAAPAGGTD